MEFLFRGDTDAVCEVRGTARGGKKPSPGFNGIGLGGSPAEKQLFRVRQSLGWSEVYVMRNR